MLSLILAKKIFSLFIIMLMSMSLVRLKILKASDSKVMSILLLYLFFPCVIIDAFQVDFTPEIQHGLLLSTAAAVAVQALLLFAGLFWQRLLHLNAVEVCSVIYSNAGNLIIPLVIAVLGAEWVIYSSTFLAVQLVLFWTHMKSTMARETHMDWRAVFTNANMIAIFIGLVLLLTGWRLPGPVNDALHSLGLVIGPSAMIIAGMLLGNMSWEKIRSYKRVPLVAFLRLIVMPLIILVFVKYSGLAAFSPDGKTILLITLLATATPSATTCVSMASLFDNQPEYASVINVVTATLCTITMPLIVWLYQL